MSKTINRKLFLYSSLFITLALNMPKMLALRKNGFIARFWHFDLNELLFQACLNFLFCMIVFYYNKSRMNLFFGKWELRKQGPPLFINVLILGIFTVIGITVQRFFFQPSVFPDGGNGLRFGLSLVLIAIELRVAYLLQESKEHEIEMEQLRNAYLQSELALLRGQLNPHFFFNAMSSLSAVVREDPPRAQQYISHLSKVFRYSLDFPNSNFVSLREEIMMVRSYSELLKMRYEDGFHLRITPEEMPADVKVPPMSLQLLVENAVKHNIASSFKPLHLEISIRDHFVVVKNNLQPVYFPEPGAGIGLANLNDRFKILLNREIEIIKTEAFFTVKLPL